jgi:adenylate cyclase
MTPAAADSPAAYLADRPVLTARQRVVLALGGPLIIGIMAYLVAGHHALERLENVTIDWRFAARGPRMPRQDIVVIEMDEASRRSLRGGEGRFDPRRFLPDLLENLSAAGARVVAFDFWLDELTTPAVDERLAKAIGAADVLLAITHTDGQRIRSAPLFLQSGPGEGSITVYPDADGVLRRLPDILYLDVVAEGGEILRIPHFPLAGALFGIWATHPDADMTYLPDGARLGEFVVPKRGLIDYAAPRGGGWRTLFFADVVRNQFERSAVEGAIVLVGESRSIVDQFTMPIAHSLNPGIYYHANVIAQILDGRRFDEYWSASKPRKQLTAGLALAAGLYAWNPRRWWRRRHATLLLAAYLVFGVALFTGGWIVLSRMLFARGVLLPVAAPLAGMALALLTGLGVQWVILSAEARRSSERTRHIEELFGQSVSHNVLNALRADPRQITDTQERDVTVLFCDLRGFTATAAEMAPRAVADMLNEYFQHVTAAVFAEDGFIDKFVGDEIMAVFSAPLPQADHVARAVRAACAIKSRLRELNVTRAARGQASLNCGIGIHTGLAAAGHIGSRDRSNYTVVGDTINIAARMQGLAHGGEILASQAVHDALAASPDGSRHELRPWKTVDIRGSSRRHVLYEVCAG